MSFFEDNGGKPQLYSPREYAFRLNGEVTLLAVVSMSYQIEIDLACMQGKL